MSRPFFVCALILTFLVIPAGGDSGGQVDGSAWMAQRRAKMEQEDREQKKKREEIKEQQEREKKDRRKSQLDALKAAMQEIKTSESPASPPRAASSLQEAARKGKETTPKAPLQILSREKKEPKKVEDTTGINFQRGQPSSKRADLMLQPQTRGISVGAKEKSNPKGELQSNGTVVFTRGVGTDEVKNQEDQEKLSLNPKDDDESSMTSKGSRQRRGKNRRKGGKGRGDSRSGGRGQARDSSGRGRGRDHHWGRGRGNRGNTDGLSSDRRGGAGRGKGRGRGHPREGRASQGGSPQHRYEIGKT